MGVVEGFVVDKLVQAQLPLFLRFCLDENIEAVVKAAAMTMHSLLVVPAEEVRSQIMHTYLHLCGLLCVLGHGGGVFSLLLWTLPAVSKDTSQGNEIFKKGGKKDWRAG